MPETADALRCDLARTAADPGGHPLARALACPCPPPHGALLVAWGIVAFRWLSWEALPFQAAIAAGVLWHALKREALLERQVVMEEQLREAQERYRDLVETLPLATYVDRPSE